ncbi:MAG: CCA tRNA nucleotidyltransferase [Loktanella sp.]|nr:CCA tRNA nucleotidyltransferase [Loktanella sp.]
MTRIDAPWLTDAAAQQVCAMLTDAGHQAWFVGGCVRNALLGEPVSDLDISTDAHPARVIALAKAAGLKPVPTGIDHGTITVVVDGHPFEVTTFRKDVETDGRRAVVAFADTMDDDARRRDFTMNALYADRTGQVADPLGGLPDLMARQVRFIEDADRRIKEDYLRILRFFRFHAWYGRDDIDADGLSACAMNSAGIESLSRERVGQEMLKLLSAPDPAPALAAMQASGVLHRVLPGADAVPVAVLVHLEGGVGVLPDPIRRLAALGGQDVTERLRLSKADDRRLEKLRDTDASPAMLGYRFGADTARDRLLVLSAVLGQTLPPDDIAAAKHGAAQIFPLKAADLMDRYQGPALGKALNEAENRWLESDFTLTKDDLLA